MANCLVSESVLSPNITEDHKETIYVDYSYQYLLP
jgi:hypothetical protein